ncbi:shikimate dehydrogenase [Striga asiatica]|uniref:Shikimate dehydrogenase n=1 Tax=Striga asiatica TaxID=4170 RepID=A0A5A7RHN9_STRAF|nr:shikimate dehydrogenase [Striga asiatica]
MEKQNGVAMHQIAGVCVISRRDASAQWGLHDGSELLLLREVNLMSSRRLISNCSPRNLSGLNSNGSSQTLGSQPISATMKFTTAFFGTKQPANSTSCVTLCGKTKWPGGCLLRASKTTALRYGIFCSSSSSTTCCDF